MVGFAAGISPKLFLAILPRWLTRALFHQLLRIEETPMDINLHLGLGIDFTCKW